MKGSDRPITQALFEAATAVRANAYAPYSNFLVGAAILTDRGEIFAGANVENASYPTGLCAEAGAIAAMIAAGDRTIVEALVLGDGPEAAVPCGACRQRLSEFAAPDMLVHVAGPEGIRASYALSTLLPASFKLDRKR